MLDAVEEKLASADEGTPTSDQGSVRPFLRDNGECNSLPFGFDDRAGVIVLGVFGSKLLATGLCDSGSLF